MVGRSIARAALVAVAVPLAARALSKAGRSMQARRSHSRTGGLLERAGSGLHVVSGRRSGR